MSTFVTSHKLNTVHSNGGESGIIEFHEVDGKLQLRVQKWADDGSIHSYCHLPINNWELNALIRNALLAQHSANTPTPA
jgi:hypothetical protein